MYGTVARTHVKPENRAKLADVMEHQRSSISVVPGYVSGYVLYENDSDMGWLFAIFEDRESYDKNADSPEQDARYTEVRALMEGDPEWHDGEIVSI